jgi:hypothetical protein
MSELALKRLQQMITTAMDRSEDYYDQWIEARDHGEKAVARESFVYWNSQVIALEQACSILINPKVLTVYEDPIFNT